MLHGQRDSEITKINQGRAPAVRPDGRQHRGHCPDPACCPRFLLGSRLPKQKGVLAFLWYFLCLGAGYILIQVALIQKFVLLLGHPTYALTVIVFSMLVASGAGSYFSRRVDRRMSDQQRCSTALLVRHRVSGRRARVRGSRPLAQVAAALAAARRRWRSPLLAIAPAAFLMGMPFPSGLRRLEERHPPSVRWAWSLNAAASVLGSAGAIVLAIYSACARRCCIGAGAVSLLLSVVDLSVFWTVVQTLSVFASRSRVLDEQIYVSTPELPAPHCLHFAYNACGLFHSIGDRMQRCAARRAC